MGAPRFMDQHGHKEAVDVGQLMEAHCTVLVAGRAASLAHKLSDGKAGHKRTQPNCPGN